MSNHPDIILTTPTGRTRFVLSGEQWSCPEGCTPRMKRVLRALERADCDRTSPPPDDPVDRNWWRANRLAETFGLRVEFHRPEHRPGGEATFGN